MESYFIVVTDLNDAIDLMTHTLWHKTNKTHSALVDLAISFSGSHLGEASNRFIVEKGVAKRKRLIWKEENEKEIES